MRPNPYTHIERYQIDAATFAAWLADKDVREIRLLYSSGRVLVRRHTKLRRRESIGFDYDPNGVLLGHEVRVDGEQRIECAPALTLTDLDALMGHG